MKQATSWLAASVLCSVAAASLARAAAGPAQFVPHDIDTGFRGGYSVSVADFNRDGRLDVMANSLSVQEVAWYENPGWARHVIVAGMSSIVNQAIADLDGDGIPEVAYENAFAMVPAKSEGNLWLARSQGDPRQPWKAEKIDAYPTSHHLIWLDLDGDGRKELVNAPLVGPKSLAPTYDQDKVSVFWYSQDDWRRRTIDDSISGIIHRVRSVRWDSGSREALLVASFDGIGLYRATGSGAGMKFEKTMIAAGHDTEKSPRLGSSDAGAGTQAGRRFIASIEPWHGNEVVVYTNDGGTWRRRVIFDRIANGHEVAIADLNGDARDDVIANDNARGPTESNPAAPLGGVHVFYAPDDPAKGEWRYQRVEASGGMNGCAPADLNGDTRIDLVCTGSSNVVRWYENKGQ